MMKLRLVLVVGIVMGSLVGPSPTATATAQTTQVHRDIKRLAALTHVDLLIEDVITNTMKKLEFSFPQVSPDVIREFMSGVDADKAVEDILVPIYQRHFSPSEIQELLRFYESPVGKKMMAVQPQIMQEALETIQPWGHELAKEFINQLDIQQ